MRIALVTTKSELGGSQTHVRDLMQVFRDRAHLHLLTSGEDWLVQQARAMGIPFTRIDALANSLSPSRALAGLRELIGALRVLRPDVIHAHSAKGGALARLAGWRLGIPVVYTVHGFGFKVEAPLKQRLALRVLEHLLAPLTTRMICVSENESRLAARLPIADARVSVIRNGIADSPLLAAPDAEPPQIVTVARIAAPKRHDLLLEALAILKRRHQLTPPAWLLGGGPGAGRLQRQAESAGLGGVLFCGDVDDVAQRLAGSQIFVLLSDHEGLPVSVLEAMRAGLAIVASNLPGIREQLAEGEALLVENHPDAVAEALHRLLRDGALRQQLGHAARRRYALEFGLPAMAERTWREYQQALDHPRAAVTAP